MPGLWFLHERVLHASVDPEWQRYAFWVAAHETAHFRFGHLVDARHPEDLWLTEGVATYLCHRAMEERAPECHPWAAFHVLEESEAHDADDGSDAHPIAARNSEAAIRGGIPSLAYAKPAAVIRHLETLIGRQAVDAGLALLLHRADGATTGCARRASIPSSCGRRPPHRYRRL